MVNTSSNEIENTTLVNSFSINDLSELNNGQHRQNDYHVHFINNNLRQLQILDNDGEIFERRPRPQKRLSVHYSRDLNLVVAKNRKLNQKKSNSSLYLSTVSEERENMILKKNQFLTSLNKIYSIMDEE